jgi:hypothetical protein
MIVVEHAADTLTSQDDAVFGCVVVRGCDELVAERLMRPLSVIVLDVLSNELTLAQRYDSLKHSRRTDPIQRSA